MKKKASYPPHLSFIERLAKKVITRVVSDGIQLDNAIKEASSFAKLSTQQMFHLCSVLEDYGQVFNGDSKNYYFTPNEMGKEFPKSQNGYVVYAGLNNKTSRMGEVFKTVEALKKKGFSDKDILNINGELKEVLDVMAEFDTNYKSLVNEYESSQTQQSQPNTSGESLLEKGKDWVAKNILPQPGLSPVPASDKNRMVVGQLTVEEDDNKDTQKATPNSVEQLKSAPAEDTLEVTEEESLDFGGDNNDLSVEEDSDFGSDENIGLGEGGDNGDMGGNISASIKPTPEDLMSKMESAPKWEVKNVLSMQMAERYYKEIQKDLDAVVSNPNIDWSSAADAVSKYDKARASIEAALEKISEAQKGAEKIEKKEVELEEKYKSKSDIPTEELISGQPIEEESVVPDLEVPEA